WRRRQLAKQQRLPGTPPPVMPQTTEAELPAAVARAVAEHHGPGTTAVIAPHELTDALAEVDGEAVRVLTVSEVKGLEFDTVLLVEPARIVEESPRGLNDLYVALTRATQRLHVLHTAELPAVLGALA
uniref:ATP-binding domain-containing protein n=1 Tax=Nocardia farcinica TaxID=37329 RepID=UPI002455DEE5